MTGVFIDRDISHRTFLRQRKALRKRYSEWLGKFRRAGTFSVNYRPSSGGHTHLSVGFFGFPDLTEYERLLLRAHLGDDWKRIVLDMKRLAVGNTQVDRAWDVRYTAGKLIRSGMWTYWFTVRTDRRGRRRSGRRSPAAISRRTGSSVGPD